MAKVRKIVTLLWGLFLGNIFCFIFLLRYGPSVKNVCLIPDEEKESVQSGKYTGKRSARDGHDINLIMVGVMTAPQYFDTRAKAVYDTWGQEIPGDIKFYSSEGSYSSHIPIIGLEGVDDIYPPQKKSLMMLKHMHDNYLDKYEWFMRADDDVYIRPYHLGQLLRSVDSKKTWFIGQTGRGNSEEFGLLSLDSDENFCMGGPGVIFSRETLKKVAPFVEVCLRHLYTTHEDVELGRCVRRFAGVSCTWSYQMQVIFYHNQSGHSAFTGNLKQKEIHQAITLHPVKDSENLYRLHSYFKCLKIQNNQHDSLNLQRDLLMSMTALGYEKHSAEEAPIDNSSVFIEQEGRYLKSTNLWGVAASVRKHPSSNLQNIYEWEFLSNSLYSPNDLNPKRRIGSSLKEGLSDVIVEVMELINHYSKQRGRLIEFKEILYCYWRFNPIYGIEYILDLLLVYRKYRGHKMTIQVRRHAYVQQTFTGLYIRDAYAYNDYKEVISDMKSVPVHKQIEHALLNLHRNLQPFFKLGSQNKEEMLHFILPLCGRFEIFQRFLKNYEDVCLASRGTTTLDVILYENPQFPEDVEKTIKLIEDIQNKYYDSKISYTLIEEKFSRGRALQHGVNNRNEQDLMLFIDVDMLFSEKTLNRIRLNTVLNKSIYFPIVFSHYNPKILGENYLADKNSLNSLYMINDNNGFWRQFGFGIVSLYKSDYLNLGGFNLMISGWGFEDVTFYDKVVKSNLNIVRSADSSLIHVYHVIFCDENLDYTQKNMCAGTEASALGSLKNLQIIYTRFKKLFVQASVS